MPAHPHIAVLLLNYNGKALLERYLPILKDCSYPDKTIYVIDNGSTDDSLPFLRSTHRDVVILENGKNLGYAGGYNKGVGQLDASNAADYFILLNTDVEPSPGFIEPLVAMMERDPMIGICQPKILSLADRRRFEYAGGAGGWIDSLGYTFTRGRIFDHCEEDQGQYDDDIEIFWASGACMMIRPGLYRELGGFYEYFFMYSEEVDFCWRARIAGFKVAACTSSVVYHRETAPLGASPQRVYFNFRNNLVMLCRNSPMRKLPLLLFLRAFLNALAILRFLAQGRFRAAGKAFSAHAGFLRWLLLVRPSPGPAGRPRERIALSDLAPTYKGSVALQYFFFHKKTFSRYVLPKPLSRSL